MAGRYFALFAASLLLLAGAAHSQDLVSEYFDEVEWVSDISYANQIPLPTTSEATGTAYYTLIDTSDYLAVNFTLYIENYVIPGISNDNRTITFAHIHVGTATENGPILVVLYSAANGGPADIPTPVTNAAEFLLAQGSITPESFVLPGWTFDSFLEAMDNGTLYTNVHSTTYPNGELRAQIYPVTLELPTVSSQSI